MNTDDLFAQIEADEAEDRIQDSGLAAPVDYARSRAMRPQLIYYHIRQGNLGFEYCACGRRVIKVDEADRLLKKGRYAHEVGRAGEESLPGADRSSTGEDE